MEKVSLVGLKPWEYQFWRSSRYSFSFEGYRNDDLLIGLDRKTSYRHPMFDKLYLYKMQGIHCGTGEFKESPVWVGDRYEDDLNELVYDRTTDIGKKVWRKNLPGINRLVDFVMSRGEVAWQCVSYVYKDENGMTLKYKVTSDTWEPANRFLKKYFPFFHGPISLDMIGNHVVSVRCHPSVFLMDLYDVDNFGDFLVTNQFGVDISNWKKRNVSEPRWSWIYYSDKNAVLENIVLKEKTINIKSIQKTYLENKPLDTNNKNKKLFQVAIINTEGVEKRPEIILQTRKTEEKALSSKK